MDEDEFPKKLWTNPGGNRRRGRPKSNGLTQGNLMVEIGERMFRTEYADDICIRYAKAPQVGIVVVAAAAAAANDDDDDDDDDI